MTALLAAAGGVLAALNLFPATARWWQMPISALLFCAAVLMDTTS